VESMIGQLEQAFLIWLVRLWTGFGSAPSPIRSESVVVNRLDGLAAEAVPTLLWLQSEFYSSTAYDTSPSVVEAGRQARREFLARVPSIPSDVADALEWCYTYDCR
jgi:hypothetical protein